MASNARLRKFKTVWKTKNKKKNSSTSFSLLHTVRKGLWLDVWVWLMNTMFLEIFKASSQNSSKIYINSNPVLKIKKEVIFIKILFTPWNSHFICCTCICFNIFIVIFISNFSLDKFLKDGAFQLLKNYHWPTFMEQFPLKKQGIQEESTLTKLTSTFVHY